MKKNSQISIRQHSDSIEISENTHTLLLKGFMHFLLNIIRKTERKVIKMQNNQAIWGNEEYLEIELIKNNI